MLVAAVSAHLRSGFFIQNGGYEYTLVVAAVALGLAFTGPGAFSLDQALGISWSGEAVGMAALAAGLLGGAVPLLARSRVSLSPSVQESV